MNAIPYSLSKMFFLEHRFFSLFLVILTGPLIQAVSIKICIRKGIHETRSNAKMDWLDRLSACAAVENAVSFKKSLLELLDGFAPHDEWSLGMSNASFPPL